MGVGFVGRATASASACPFIGGVATPNGDDPFDHWRRRRNEAIRRRPAGIVEGFDADADADVDADADDALLLFRRSLVVERRYRVFHYRVSESDVARRRPIDFIGGVGGWVGGWVGGSISIRRVSSRARGHQVRQSITMTQQQKQQRRRRRRVVSVATPLFWVSNIKNKQTKKTQQVPFFFFLVVVVWAEAASPGPATSSVWPKYRYSAGPSIDT